MQTSPLPGPVWPPAASPCSAPALLPRVSSRPSLCTRAPSSPGSAHLSRRSSEGSGTPLSRSGVGGRRGAWGASAGPGRAAHGEAVGLGQSAWTAATLGRKRVRHGARLTAPRPACACFETRRFAEMSLTAGARVRGDGREEVLGARQPPAGGGPSVRRGSGHRVPRPALRGARGGVRSEGISPPPRPVLPTGPGREDRRPGPPPGDHHHRRLLHRHRAGERRGRRPLPEVGPPGPGARGAPRGAPWGAPRLSPHPSSYRSVFSRAFKFL